MKGKRNPIAELVVAPKNDMTVAIFVKRREKAKLTSKIKIVQKTFILAVIGTPVTSSIESLVGNT